MIERISCDICHQEFKPQDIVLIHVQIAGYHQDRKEWVVGSENAPRHARVCLSCSRKAMPLSVVSLLRYSLAVAGLLDKVKENSSC
jgi:hypothetical protein